MPNCRNCALYEGNGSIDKDGPELQFVTAADNVRNQPFRTVAIDSA